MIEKTEDTTLLNRNLIKNISILTSLLFLGVILMVIVNHYEKRTIPEDQATTAAQLLNQ